MPDKKPLWLREPETLPEAALYLVGKIIVEGTSMVGVCAVMIVLCVLILGLLGVHPGDLYCKPAAYRPVIETPITTADGKGGKRMSTFGIPKPGLLLLERLQDKLARLSGLPGPPGSQTLPAPVTLTHRAPARRRKGHKLSYPLVQLSRRDAWTVQDALENTIIFGETGGGKTSGSGDAIARAMLKAGFGLLITSHKADERERWMRLCKETGRARDLLIVHPKERWRCNLLEYQFVRAGEGAGHTENAVEMFMTLAESRYQHGKRTTSDAYWTEAARRLLRHLLDALIAGGEPVSMDNLQAVLQGLPFPDAAARTACYPPGSFLDACLSQATTREQQGQPMLTTAQALRGYFEREWAAPGAERQNAGVLSTLQSILDPLQSGPIKELFFTTTNFVPDFVRQGAVILLDLPVLEWEQIGLMAPKDVPLRHPALCAAPPGFAPRGNAHV